MLRRGPNVEVTVLWGGGGGIGMLKTIIVSL